MLGIGQQRSIEKIPWRLLDTGLRSGAENMAIDEAVLEAYAAGEAAPTLRFYGWRPWTLSLGYFQQSSKVVDFKACQERGIDVVRRLTGGRAVLHATELTYSIIVGEDYPDMPLTITASYRYLSRGLLLGLTKLGLAAEMTKPAAAYGQKKKAQESAACFDAPANYELTVESKKLIGSAQVRRQGVILQHGSILLDFSAADLSAVLKTEAGGKPELQQLLSERVMDLRRALGRTVTWEEVRQAMEEGLREALSIDLQRASLTKNEIKRAEELTREKYSSNAWTNKR